MEPVTEIATREEIADAVLGVLDRQGWCDNGPTGLGGSLCLLMAMDKAWRGPLRVKMTTQDKFGQPVWPVEMRDFRMAVREAIRENFPGRPDGIDQFNDHSLTTREDINLVVKLAGQS